jgi:hypothetical protein
VLGRLHHNVPLCWPEAAVAKDLEVDLRVTHADSVSRAIEMVRMRLCCRDEGGSQNAKAQAANERPKQFHAEGSLPFTQGPQ